jgi:hypothetical protein
LVVASEQYRQKPHLARASASPVATRFIFARLLRPARQASMQAPTSVMNVRRFMPRCPRWRDGILSANSTNLKGLKRLVNVRVGSNPEILALSTMSPHYPK